MLNKDLLYFKDKYGGSISMDNVDEIIQDYFAGSGYAVVRVPRREASCLMFKLDATPSVSRYFNSTPAVLCGASPIMEGDNYRVVRLVITCRPAVFFGHHYDIQFVAVSAADRTPVIGQYRGASIERLYGCLTHFWPIPKRDVLFDFRRISFLKQV